MICQITGAGASCCLTSGAQLVCSKELGLSVHQRPMDVTAAFFLGIQLIHRHIQY